MTSLFPLSSVREVWIDAYFSGDLEWLSYLEAPTFIVIEGDIVTSKKEQLQFLEVSKRKFPRGRSGVNLAHTVVEHREMSGWASVAGHFTLTRDGVVHRTGSFFEIWAIVDRRWNIYSLYLKDSVHCGIRSTTY